MLISKVPAFLRVSAEDLQEAGLEMCESVLKVYPLLYGSMMTWCQG